MHWCTQFRFAACEQIFATAARAMNFLSVYMTVHFFIKVWAWLKRIRRRIQEATAQLDFFRIDGPAANAPELFCVLACGLSCCHDAMMATTEAWRHGAASCRFSGGSAAVAAQERVCYDCFIACCLLPFPVQAFFTRTAVLPSARKAQWRVCLRITWCRSGRGFLLPSGRPTCT